MIISLLKNYSSAQKKEYLRDFLTRHGVDSHVRTSKKYGYGFLVPRKKLGFINWSHTQNELLVGLSKSPCGVDIERIDRKVKPLLNRIATLSEVEDLHRLPQNLKSIEPSLLLWVAKEAISKAYGIGFRGSFKKINIDLSSNLPWKVQVSFDVKTPLKLKDPYVNLILNDQWIIAFAGEKSEVNCYAYT